MKINFVPRAPHRFRFLDARRLELQSVRIAVAVEQIASNYEIKLSLLKSDTRVFPTEVLYVYFGCGIGIDIVSFPI